VKLVFKLNHPLISGGGIHNCLLDIMCLCLVSQNIWLRQKINRFNNQSHQPVFYTKRSWKKYILFWQYFRVNETYAKSTWAQIQEFHTWGVWFVFLNTISRVLKWLRSEVRPGAVANMCTVCTPGPQAAGWSYARTSWLTNNYQSVVKGCL
jgi:hypothetical protein